MNKETKSWMKERVIKYAKQNGLDVKFALAYFGL